MTIVHIVSDRPKRRPRFFPNGSYVSWEARNS